MRILPEGRENPEKRGSASKVAENTKMKKERNDTNAADRLMASADL